MPGRCMAERAEYVLPRMLKPIFIKDRKKRKNENQGSYRKSLTPISNGGLILAAPLHYASSAHRAVSQAHLIPTASLSEALTYPSNLSFSS